MSVIRERIIGCAIPEAVWHKASQEATRRHRVHVERAGTADPSSTGYYTGTVWKHTVGKVGELLVERYLSRVDGLELEIGEGTRGWDIIASGTPLEVKTRSIRAAENYGNGVNEGTVRRMRERLLGSPIDPLAVFVGYVGDRKLGRVTWAGIYGWAKLSQLEAVPPVLTTSKDAHVVNHVLPWADIRQTSELSIELLSHVRRAA